MLIISSAESRPFTTSVTLSVPLTWSLLVITISKSKSVSSLGVVKIRQIDGDGRNVDAWQLNNAWIKDVKFGELDYNSEEMLNVDVTLRYDNAVYQGQSGKYPRNANIANLL